MLYTVGEAAKLLNVAPSTLRYYDKEGLLPFVERSSSGIRMFKEEDFNWLYIIECLKKSGLSIKDIKHYIDLSLNGDETIDERLELFLSQKEKVLRQMNELQSILDTLNYKCWYYETAKKAGTTSVLQNMTIDDIPLELRTVKERMNSLKPTQINDPQN